MVLTMQDVNSRGPDQNCVDQIDELKRFIVNSVNRMDELKRYSEYDWRIDNGSVIETTLPELEWDDTDGLPLLFSLSNSAGENHFELIIAPQPIGQLAPTLEPLYISHRSNGKIPYSHTGNLGDSKTRLEMMMFKPIHEEKMENSSKKYIGMITGKAYNKPLKDICNLSHPLICLPDHGKKTISYKVCRVETEENNVNVNHIAKYIINPSKRTIQWIFPRRPIYEQFLSHINTERYKEGFVKLNEQCWLTRRSLDNSQSQSNMLLKNCIINDDRLKKFSDYTLREIKGDKTQMIVTSLPAEDMECESPLIFGVWGVQSGNIDDDSNYDLTINNSYNLRSNHSGSTCYTNIAPLILTKKTGTFALVKIFEVKAKDGDDDRRPRTLLSNHVNFKTHAQVGYCQPTICIPDYRKGIIFYMMDHIPIDSYQDTHILMEYVINWSENKVKWTIPYENINRSQR